MQVFITENEVGNIAPAINGREQMAKLINTACDRVYNKVMENVLLGMPDTIMAIVRHSRQLNTIREKFFSEHKDATEKSAEFSAALLSVEGDKPGAGYEELLHDAYAVFKKNGAAMTRLEDISVASKTEAAHLIKEVLNAEDADKS